MRLWVIFSIALPSAYSASSEELEATLAALAEQNAVLLKLAEEQQTKILELQTRLNKLEEVGEQQDVAIQELQEQEPASFDHGPSRGGSPRFVLSAEAGFAFFAGQANNEFPNEEFRVDDARIFLEGEVSNGVYLVSTLELFRRESGNESIEVGPLFLEVENIFKLQEHDNLFNLRLGRFDTPFGIEYVHRYVMDNPLVSHSVADIWGIDQGIALYGDEGQFSYAVAIQNGNTSLLRDFNSDKSIAGRATWDFENGLKLSGSLMRTGDLDAKKDKQSELWIGNAVFLSRGSNQTTEFSAELAQIDLEWDWNGGDLSAAYGGAWYDDNDPLGDNSRTFTFYSLEAKQLFTDRMYGALRYSGMEVPGGYPIRGNGSREIYLFGGTLTKKLERISLGLGYWASDDLLFKAEYSIEDGEQTGWTDREDTDQLAAEIGVRF